MRNPRSTLFSSLTQRGNFLLCSLNSTLPGGSVVFEFTLCHELRFHWFLERRSNGTGRSIDVLQNHWQTVEYDDERKDINGERECIFIEVIIVMTLCREVSQSIGSIFKNHRSPVSETLDHSIQVFICRFIYQHWSSIAN